MHYLLFYEVAEDYVSRRAEFRDAHLQKAWEASVRGELVLAGALANPVDGAVLLFRGDSAEVAEKFARADPYVTSGAVKRWHVREWTTVAGQDAARPIRPKAADADFSPFQRRSQAMILPAFVGEWIAASSAMKRPSARCSAGTGDASLSPPNCTGSPQSQNEEGIGRSSRTLDGFHTVDFA